MSRSCLLIGFIFSTLSPTQADETEDLLRYYETFDHQKIEKSIKSFLNAKTVDEKLKYVRDPKRVGPLMKAYYAKTGYQPEGFEDVREKELSFNERYATTSVFTGDFSDRVITVRRSIVKGADTYRVDWESWMGYGEKTPAEMRKEKPTTPFVLRVILMGDDYYNYHFSDPEKWLSFRLDVGNEREFFYGYIAKDSQLYKQVTEEMAWPWTEFLVVKVAYPKNARSQRQVEITEIIESEDWILKPELKKEKVQPPPAKEKQPADQ